MNKSLATINLIESNVNKVAKGSGKPYSVTILHYTVNGETKEKMIFDRKLRDTLTNNFHSGDEVLLGWEKNDKGYNDLVSVEANDGSAPAAHTPTYRAPSAHKAGPNDGDRGMQVGNALTNAATLMASGKAEGTLEEVASMVIRTGESLKAKLLAGDFNE